ncbi:MAG: dicarboxylate/amino acid:cation symporter [Phycisphaeraceae bacterium]|nr:dicarboxylate/amino acid:cation symporter [Phycisphaeraceae bacterium]
MEKRRRLALHWKIVIGLVLGVIVGIAIDRLWTGQTWASIGVNDPRAFMAGRGNENFASGVASEANASAGFVAGAVRFLVNTNTLIGQLFFRSLRFIAVPIVICSLTIGVASLGDLKRLGRIGGKTVGFFVFTTAISIAVGLTIADIASPGERIDPAARAEMTAKYQSNVEASRGRTSEVPSFWQQGLDLVPPNPFQALATAQMLQVIVAAMALGAALTMIPSSKSGPVIAIFDALTDAIVMLVNTIMRLAPIAVFTLVAPAIVIMGLDVLKAVGVYCLVVIVGLAAIMLIVYPLVLRLVAGVGFVRFFRALSPAMLTAFSSSSSNATLPVTISCAINRLGVSERIASFACPLGATINMAGTAMYQGVATVFIAQMYGMDLTIGQLAVIVLTATLAGIGTPGIPGAGVVMLVIVLESVGVPPDGIAVILGVDRLLDMCRTVVNVTGDAAAAAVVAKTEGELLSEAEVEKRLAEGRIPD